MTRRDQRIAVASLRDVWFAAVLMALVVGCNAQSFIGGGGRGANDDSKLSSQAGGDRPSEDGEGVPGYLTAPGQILAEVHSGELSVDGGEGAVATDHGDVRQVLVCLEAIVIDAARTAGAAGPVGEVLDKRHANADGSFTLKASVADPSIERLLVLNVSGRCLDQPTNTDPEPVNPTHAFARFADGVSFDARPALYQEVVGTALSAPAYRVCETKEGNCVSELTVRAFAKASGEIIGDAQVTITMPATACGIQQIDYAGRDGGGSSCVETEASGATFTCNSGSKSTIKADGPGGCSDTTLLKDKAQEACEKICSTPLFSSKEFGGKILLYAAPNYYDVSLSADGFSSESTSVKVSETLPGTVDLPLN